MHHLHTEMTYFTNSKHFLLSNYTKLQILWFNNYFAKLASLDGGDRESAPTFP